MRKKDIERRTSKVREIIKGACEFAQVSPPQVSCQLFFRGRPMRTFVWGMYLPIEKKGWVLVNVAKSFYIPTTLHEVAHHIHWIKFKLKAEKRKSRNDKRDHPLIFLKILFKLACWYYKGKPEKYPIKTEYPFLRRPWKKLLKNYKKGLDKAGGLWYNILHNMGEKK